MSRWGAARARVSRARASASALLLLCFIPGSAADEYSSQSLSTFVDTMLAEYDREAPPALCTAVTLALDVRHASVDDAAATMRLLADLHMSWNDSRLAWNATAWSEDSVVVSAARLWTPDVDLVSAGGASAGAGVAELRARLSTAGAVRAVRRLALSVPFALQLDDWPRDLQRAVFKFASRAHNQDEIDLIVTEYKHSILVESGAWEVVGVSGSASAWQRGEEGAVSLAVWRVAAARRGAARAAAAGAVLAAAALTLLAAAALPYSQRAPLAAAAALIAAIWLVSAIFHVPSGASTPRVVRIMCGVAAAGAASGALAVATARLAARASPPPRLLRAALTSLSALYTLTPDPEASGESKSGAWMAAAQLLDAAAVALLVPTILVLVAVHMFS